jgi:DNA repair protein SbcC/Rad50
VRPVQLDIAGFGSFREPAEVNFADADYFALVGPTGAGKSTVIDALTFALFGSVPRWNDRRMVSLALAPTVTRGTVRLVFDAAGVRYVVARELRRGANGAVTVKNARLERLADATGLGRPGDPTEVLAADSAVTGAVEQLLGLTFEHFRTCVVLPQGEFAQFLHAKPSDRQQILTRLLGLGVYETVGKEANARAAAHRQRSEVLGEQLAGYADATEDAEVAATGRVTALRELVTRVDAALRGLAERAATAQQAAAEKARLTAERDQLAAVRMPAGLPALTTRLRAAEDAQAAAHTRRQDAEHADTAARDRLAAAPDRAPLEHARRTHDELTDLRTRKPDADTAHAAAQEDLDRAAAAVDDAKRLLEQARAARDEASRTDLAAALQPHLVPGRPCPVCEQTVATLPAPRHATDLSAANEAVTAAERRVATRNEKLMLASRAEHEAGSELTRLTRRIDDLRHALIGAPETADEARAQVARIDRLEEAARRADRELRDARDAAAAADRASAQARSDAAQARKALAMVRDPLVSLGAPSIDEADLEGSWRSLVSWAGAASDARAEQLAAAVAHAAAARRTLADATDALARAAGDAERIDMEWVAASRAEQAAADLVTNLDDRMGELRAALADAPTADEVAAALGELDRLTEAARLADQRLRAARSDADAAARDLRQAHGALGDARAALAATRDTLIVLGPPALGGQDLLADWTTLTGWAARDATARAGRLPGLAEELDRAQAAHNAAEQTLAELLATHGVSPPPGSLADTASPAVAAILERARAELSRVTERRAEAARLGSEIKQADEAHQVARQLGLLLRSNQFPRWLVAAALDILVADASVTLAELSGGQFELTHADGEFLVVDHADADSRRPVKTLSGGETFQASLALALALSAQLTSMAAAGAARLDSIFLDEGFGSLDEATLDVVASTLESLAGGGGRMVGLITHVRALADRVPVRFAVSRDQRTSHLLRESL